MEGIIALIRKEFVKDAWTMALVPAFAGRIAARRRNGEAERPGGLEVDGEFVLGWRLHWKVGGFLTFEDAIDVAGPAPVLLDRIRSVGDQAAAGDIKALPVDCGSSTKASFGRD
jgi:hypothetical protein